MMRRLVLPADYGEYAWEVEAKGVFWGASVAAGERQTPVTFYDPVRLRQDVDEELGAGRVFGASRLLVVERVTVENMQAAVSQAPLELFD